MALTSWIRFQCHRCWRLVIPANWSCRFPIVWPIEGWIGEGAGAACAWHCSSAMGGWTPWPGVAFGFFEPVVKCWQLSAEVDPFLSPIQTRTLRIKCCPSWNNTAPPLRYVSRKWMNFRCLFNVEIGKKSGGEEHHQFFFFFVKELNKFQRIIECFVLNRKYFESCCYSNWIKLRRYSVIFERIFFLIFKCLMLRMFHKIFNIYFLNI